MIKFAKPQPDSYGMREGAALVKQEAWGWYQRVGMGSGEIARCGRVIRNPLVQDPVTGLWHEVKG